MEVHHHPHVEKKNFKEYFLEFLMIFLAVTMGFFAENIREYLSDREKEETYINSFTKNINADSVAIEASFQDIQYAIRKMDTLMRLIKSGQYKSEQEILYRLAYQTRGFQQFGYSNVTFEQMKNAGGLALIRDEAIRNGIVNYNNFVNGAIRQLESRMFETEKNQADWQSNILDDSFYPRADSIIYQHALSQNFHVQQIRTTFNQGQEAEFLKLYNLLFERSIIFNYYKLEMGKLKNENKQLLEAIEKKYGKEQ